jgi:hypothetical protein
MHIPQFLYVPKIKPENYDRLIIETRNNLKFQIFEFETHGAASQYLLSKEPELKEFGSAVAIHRKYPFFVLCVDRGNIDKLERVVKLTELASDYYADFYLFNKKISKPVFDKNDTNFQKLEKHFYHWVFGENRIRTDQPTYLINLEFGLSIKFNYADAMFSDYEDFYNRIADIQFLTAVHPSGQELESILIDAYNYLAIEDRILDDDLKDDFDDIF